jgi:hypothetical protein
MRPQAHATTHAAKLHVQALFVWKLLPSHPTRQRAAQEEGPSHSNTPDCTLGGTPTSAPVSEAEPQLLFVKDQQDLLNKLTPGVDGVILSSGNKRATFLPQVWQQLPDKQQFINHLKQKAGLDIDEWPVNMQIQLYQTQSF